MVGWNRTTYGYHAEPAERFERYDKDDVVGCGYLQDKSLIYRWDYKLSNFWAVVHLTFIFQLELHHLGMEWVGASHPRILASPRPPRPPRKNKAHQTPKKPKNPTEITTIFLHFQLKLFSIIQKIW